MGRRLLPRLLMLVHFLLLLLLSLLHLLRLLLVPLLHLLLFLLRLLLSWRVGFLLRHALMLLVLLLLKLLPFLVLLLVHLVLLLLVFLVRFRISGTRWSIRTVGVWQVVRMHVVRPVGVVLRTIRVWRAVRVWRSVGIILGSVRVVRRPVFIPSPAIWRRIVPASFFRGHYRSATKCSRSLCGSNRRLATIFRRPQLAVASRRLYVLMLHRYRRQVPLPRRCFLLRSRALVDSAVRTVVTHARNVDVGHPRLIYVVNYGHVYVVHCAVVIKTSAVPTSALITVAKVSVAVVNPAIKSHARSPKAFVEDKGCTTPAPVSGSPQETGLRRQYPRSRHPIVVAIFVIPCPIARRPDVPLARTYRLLVNRQLRWSKTDRHADGHLRKRGSRNGKTHQRHYDDHQKAN